MPDIADIADIAQQQMLNAALEKRQPSGPPHTGCCHYCGKDVGPDKRWCDPECHHAWNDEQDLLRRTGRLHAGRV